MGIRLILLDIDGVLTDGRTLVDEDGRESKTLHFRDVDAVFAWRREGRRVAMVTGEGGLITECFRERFKPDYFYNGCRDKSAALDAILDESGLTAAEAAYLGDASGDLPAMRRVGLAVCPADAIRAVRALAHLRLESRGGEGCAWELYEWLAEQEKR